MSSSKYDRAITIFSPDGHLFQVEYAQEAIGIRGKDCVVLCVEKKVITKLQTEQSVRKIALLDDHVAVAFSGLTADARSLINRIRIECKSYKLTVEDPVSMEYISRFVAQLKQKYTQSNGRRPFGVSYLIVGFNQDGSPHLYQTDPSGTYYEQYASAIGKNSKIVKEFLEKNYSEDAVKTEEDCIKLAIRSFTDAVQSGAKHMELAVMRFNDKAKRGDSHVYWKMFDQDSIDKYVKIVESEREEMETAKQKS